MCNKSLSKMRGKQGTPRHINSTGIVIASASEARQQQTEQQQRTLFLLPIIRSIILLCSRHYHNTPAYRKHNSRRNIHHDFRQSITSNWINSRSHRAARLDGVPICSPLEPSLLSIHHKSHLKLPRVPWHDTTSRCSAMQPSVGHCRQDDRDMS